VSEVKATASVATLIGDLVGSRTAADRQRLHARFAAVLAAANRDLAPVGRLRITVGDEFQGSFADLGAALHAAWRVRWALADQAELRFGLGWGPVRVLDPATLIEDGPGWWVARDAVEAVAAEAARPGRRHLRTAYRRAADVGGPESGPVNAALLCRDHLVGSLSPRSRRILARLVAGDSQAEVAEAEGISPSAVSQRVRRDGLAVIEAAQEMLEGTR
jgi:hypothetical protein